MTHTPHSFADEVPGRNDGKSSLQRPGALFGQLTDNYHLTSRASYRAETNLEPPSEEHLSQMLKKRLDLNDQIHQFLRSAD